MIEYDKTEAYEMLRPSPVFLSDEDYARNSSELRMAFYRWAEFAVRCGLRDRTVNRYREQLLMYAPSDIRRVAFDLHRTADITRDEHPSRMWRVLAWMFDYAAEI